MVKKSNDPLTLYRMADGTTAKASDCHENTDGVLCAKETGVPVSMDEAGNPMTLAQEKEDHAAAGDISEAGGNQVPSEEKKDE